ncbi:hypothetical protein [Ornithinimicrobium kibberense]|uniref:hypothetical protein n=1 Tax=Ornithinimicrobium kibberense TaxID=282060 RepID=UPI0036067D1F
MIRSASERNPLASRRRRSHSTTCRTRKAPATTMAVGRWKSCMEGGYAVGRPGLRRLWCELTWAIPLGVSRQSVQRGVPCPTAPTSSTASRPPPATCARASRTSTPGSPPPTRRPWPRAS